jgi:hypothetical protein
VRFSNAKSTSSRGMLNRPVTRLAQDEGVPLTGHDTAGDRNHNPVGVVLNADRVIRPWNLNGLSSRQEPL